MATMTNKIDGIHRVIDLLTQNLVNIKDTKGELLLELPDGTLVDTRAWNAWEWTQGIGLYGLFIYYDLTQKEQPLAIIKNWFHDRFSEGTVSKNINTMAVFLTLGCLYEQEQNRSYIPYLDSWAEWIVHELPKTKFGGFQHVTYIAEHKNQMWIDTLMMSVLPLAKIGLTLNRPHYLEICKNQFLLHIKYLAHNKSGLFFHAWTFEEGGSNFANALWARGNSWMTVAIPDFIEMLDLKPGDGFREFLVTTLEAQVAALGSLQGGDGRWHTILDDTDSYLESSATAGFAYGIFKAVRKKYISKEYLPVAERAIKAILNNIDSDGELLGTSFGTGVGTTLQAYKDIPVRSMPYGQAMAIMALAEYTRVFY